MLGQPDKSGVSAPFELPQAAGRATFATIYGATKDRGTLARERSRIGLGEVALTQ